jgi:hypothetical protein
LNNEYFLEIAREEKIVFALVNSPIEDCRFDLKFDFIFSINVMEHLKDPYSVSIQMVKNLKAGCFDRFFAQTMTFHTNLTSVSGLVQDQKWLFSTSKSSYIDPYSRKRSSEVVFIIELSDFEKDKKALNQKNIHLSANPNSLYEVICRSINDLELKKRHKSLTNLVRILFFLTLHYLAKLVPVNYQPVMDIKITLLPS